MRGLDLNVHACMLGWGAQYPFARPFINFHNSKKEGGAQGCVFILTLFEPTSKQGSTPVLDVGERV